MFVYQESVRNLQKKNESTAVSKILRLQGGSFQSAIPLNLRALYWVSKNVFKIERAFLLHYQVKRQPTVKRFVFSMPEYL